MAERTRSGRAGTRRSSSARQEVPLALTPGERVALIVVRHPDPRRWDLERLARSGGGEDRRLAEQGLTEWADALDEEDRS
jgi:hypothetical protein